MAFSARAVGVVVVAVVFGAVIGTFVPTGLETLWRMTARSSPSAATWVAVQRAEPPPAVAVADLATPLARAVAEQRDRLWAGTDDKTWVATANFLAGLARQMPAYGSDPVVLLALRAGAVRLVLNKGDASSRAAVGRLMNHIAVRLERRDSKGLKPVMTSSAAF